MADQVALHNRIAGEIVASIVKTPLDAGGKVTDVMVLLETVIVGVCLACVRLGGDDKVLDVVLERARARLAEQRLGNLEAAGNG